jgi:isocitrate dehydrogenase
VSNPEQFDVMVMPNLYGNVVSNVCAGLVGGPGLVPGANHGEHYALFETVSSHPSTHTPLTPHVCTSKKDDNNRNNETSEFRRQISFI